MHVYVLLLPRRCERLPGKVTKNFTVCGPRPPLLPREVMEVCAQCPLRRHCCVGPALARRGAVGLPLAGPAPVRATIIISQNHGTSQKK